ncbi:hypothetical protein EDF57_103575 [Novosphingobium sp. PhB55]|uniref:DUF551 domain-containing protein n=1 Tax=Novosphingobium sp. PhB55 TaxID=2485106 RepID=UPI0010EBED1C|nr:DUF551 domain-containing protein [Novosphingobium sp. PhB55]TDW65391.1 hypothetical protein EDF57_103575 [Novosphingobium sp. PhB55]
MATGIPFPEANTILRAPTPEDAAAGTVYDLHVHRYTDLDGQPNVISKWQFAPKELAQIIAAGGVFWFHAWGHTHPPVGISGDNPFVRATRSVEQAGDENVSFQEGVAAWMQACFGPVISADQVERADRFIEEALELAQTMPGFTAERAHALVDYVFNREVGERSQEVGGVMVTLAALCNTADINIEEAANAELARVWTKVAAIRAKQAAKPTGSALPIARPAEPAGEEPVAWVSPLQLKAIANRPQDTGGEYIPIRKSRAGQFTMPVYAHPALSNPERSVEAWRTIESAPKDGTMIDVWRDGTRETVYWGLPPHECGEMGSYCDSDWHSIKKPGWICSTFGEFVGGKHDPFTHWMPLPVGPSVSAAQTRGEGK